MRLQRTVRQDVARRSSVVAGLVAIAAVASIAFAPTAASRVVLTEALVPPMGGPDPAQMALRTTDLRTGAKVKRQRYVRDRDFVSYYVREFRSGTSIGGSRADELESDVGLMASADEAASYFAASTALFKTKKGRAALVKLILADLPKEAKGTLTVRFGRVQSLHVGQSSIIVPITFTFLGALRLPFVLAIVRTDRVVGTLDIGGVVDGKIAVADVRRLAGAVAGHMMEGLTPVSTALPTISGTPQVGATLTAAAGSWTNNPTSFTYQWLRCDAAGANCQPIAGAAAASYLAADADVASTLSVTVVAANGPARSAAAQSAPTSAVAPAPPPG
jgi:hypothetical protein